MNTRMSQFHNFIKICNDFLLFLTLICICIFIMRYGNNNPESQELKKLDDYYYEELCKTYEYHLDPIYSTLDETYSDYIIAIEDSMRADDYNTRRIKELESRAYAKVIESMKKSNTPIADQP